MKETPEQICAKYVAANKSIRDITDKMAKIGCKDAAEDEGLSLLPLFLYYDAVLSASRVGMTWNAQTEISRLMAVYQSSLRCVEFNQLIQDRKLARRTRGIALRQLSAIGRKALNSECVEKEYVK